MSAVEQKLNWVFGLALLVLAAVGLVSYRSTTQLAVTSQEVTHSREVLGTIAELRSSLAQAQSASRGYRLTGQAPQLRAYRTAASLAGQDVDQLRRLTSDNPVQQKTLASLDPLTQARLKQLADALVFQPNRPGREETQVEMAQSASDLSPQIAAALRNMEDEEQRLLQQRAQAAEASIRRAHFFIIFASLLAFAFVGASFAPIRRDIQERKRAALALRREKEFTGSLIRSSTDGILAYDRECRFTEWNPGMERLSGVARSDVLGRCAFDVFPFLKDTGVDKLLLGSLEGKTGIASDQPFEVPQTGKKGFFEGYYAPVRDEAGQIVGGLGIIRDLGERKRAEKQFRDLLEAAPDAMVIVDGAGRIVLVNAQTEGLFGYRREELLGRSAEILLPERFRARPIDGRPGTLGAPPDREPAAGWELLGLRSDGSEFPVEIRQSPLETKRGVLLCSAIRDITARKRAERELQIRLGQHAALAGLGESALSGIDLSALMDKAVEQIARTLGVEYAKVLELLPGGESLLLRAGVGWKPGAVGQATVSAGFDSQAGFTLLAEGPVIVQDLRSETRFHGPSLLWEHDVVSGLSVAIAGPGHPYGVLGAHTRSRRVFSEDDTHFLQAVANILAFAIEQRRSHAALRESEERFREIAENIREGFWMTDSTGTQILYVNPAYESLWGYPGIILRQHPLSWQNAIHSDDRDRVARAYREQVENGNFESEFRIVRPDGSVRWIWDRSAPVRDAAGQVRRIVGIATDITELKQAEESLRHLSSELLRLQDEERRRIARELHDSTGQYLAALSINLARVQEGAASLDEESRAALAESFDLVNQSVQEIRTLSYLLHPPLLEDLGLASALRWYTQGFAERSGIRVEMDLGEDVGRLPREVEMALFRVVQESLVNVHRHSGSSVAIIRMARKNGEISLEVADRGRGIPAGAWNEADHGPRPGVGIFGMRERVKEQGGQLEIRSGETGTCVSVSIPVPKTSAA